MSTLKLKASELRGLMKYQRNEGDSRNSSEAKRVTLGVTHNGEAYGMLYMTRQVGFRLRMFDPIVEMGTQQEHEVFDITPDDTLCTVNWKEIDKSLATFGNRVVTMTLTSEFITLEDESGSRVVVYSAESRQLVLPLEQSGSALQASKVASAIDSEQFGEEAVQVSVTALCNALLPAMKVVTLPGNASDMKGVHLHAKPNPLPPCPEGKGEAAAKTRNDRYTLRIVGAHKDAVFVYEAEEAVVAQDEGTALDCIISSDAAKRLRELLVREVSMYADEKGDCNRKVFMKQRGCEVLEVCCGNWMMTIDLLDICTADCDAYMDMPGKNVWECNRVALFQNCNGMFSMGEDDAFWHLKDKKVLLEGEAQQHQGQRKLAIEADRYGAGEEIPVRKHVIRPVIAMLSAASAAANNKMVKVMADGDDDVLCLQCDEYHLFVK